MKMKKKFKFKFYHLPAARVWYAYYCVLCTVHSTVPVRVHPAFNFIFNIGWHTKKGCKLLLLTLGIGPF